LFQLTADNLPLFATVEARAHRSSSLDPSIRISIGTVAGEVIRSTAAVSQLVIWSAFSMNTRHTCGSCCHCQTGAWRSHCLRGLSMVSSSVRNEVVIHRHNVAQTYLCPVHDWLPFPNRLRLPGPTCQTCWTAEVVTTPGRSRLQVDWSG